MPQPCHLGNDIVAITSPRCRGKADDARFLQRVFSPKERQAIATSVSPETSLWLHWAGKEAIYKSATKALGAPPVFHHDRFQISLSEDLYQSPGILRGTGSYEAFSFQLRVDLQPDFVHALAWEGSSGEDECEGDSVVWQTLREGEGESEKDLRECFSKEEWDCVSHRASALTRLGARKALASALELDEGRLEIRCGPGAPGRRVPLVFLDGRESPVDLSLSHDAHLMAWAFFLRPGTGLYLSQGL